MRNRLYYLIPDVAHAKQMFDHLLLAQVEARHIHVLAKDDIDLTDLPKAGFNQRTDVLHGAVQGIIFGGLTGMLIGLFLLFNPFGGVPVNYILVLLLALLGAIFGAWVASLIGLDIFNTQLRQFRRDIDQGKILMMVDVPKSEIDRITAIIKKDDPDAVAQGIEPTLPAFP